MRRLCFVFIAIVVFGVACEDDPASTEDMVTVTGVVRSADTGIEVAGVRVGQYGTPYVDKVDTGTDGAYELEVPRGTTLTLITDDFNPAIDEFYPMINCDVVPIVANDDLTGVHIHACPNTPDLAGSSLYTWETYLRDCDDTQNGDLFQPKRMADAGGAITVLIVDCDLVGFAGMSCTTGVPSAPFGYCNVDSLAVCNAFYPASVTEFDSVWSWGAGFFDTTFTAASVTLTVTDNWPSRGIDMPEPFECPVEKGVMTMAIVGIFDNKAVNFPTWWRLCGRP